MIRPARQARTRALIASLALGGAMLLSVGCETGSSDSTTATLSDNAGRHYNFSGHYANHNDANEALPLVYPSGRQSGQALMWIRLLQSGSVLEAYDDAGETWSGGISSIANETAQFTLQGRTTAGAPVNIAGALRYADQSSTMDATWIEPTFSGNLVATAAVASPTQSATPLEAIAGRTAIPMGRAIAAVQPPTSPLLHPAAGSFPMPAFRATLLPPAAPRPIPGTCRPLSWAPSRL
ncbi:MAG: hypothetical protein PHO14_08660 [Kiritimatiellae bacterium]|nr:hypothetical protein [Kiritimatiellia bacterium]MDD4342287.1 hypothetical protein [Kiritimatiellia bacterium]